MAPRLLPTPEIMAPIRSALFVGFALFLTVVARAAGPAGFELDLSSAKDLPPGLTWVAEGPQNEPCLRIDVFPKDASAPHLLTIPIDIQALRGHEILLSYDVRAENVSKPALDYNGIKAQLHFVSAASGPRWFNEGLLYGTIPWRHSELIIRVDDDATDGVLQLGMQECSGTAWLANVALTVRGPRPARPPRLRGVVSPSSFSPKDFEELAAWKVNLIRWQLINPEWPRTEIPSDPAVYGPWLDKKLDELALVLEQAKQIGARVVVDLHAPPGGRLPDGTLRMVLDKEMQDYFLFVWEKIAQRFKGNPTIWAYDLMNEPLQNKPSPPGVMDWFALQEAAARAVRKIDPDTTILIEADQWDSPEAFTWMRPVWVTNVVYETHMYWPYEYTHQGFERPWNTPADRPPYPGTFNERPFDRAALIRHLAPVREFQRAYGAKIFVGEFSVTRWAPGAARYLSDVIGLFEEYGWDWTYHAFREQSAWSLEHENLPQDSDTPAQTPPDRANVVRSWFLKNAP